MLGLCSADRNVLSLKVYPLVKAFLAPPPVTITNRAPLRKFEVLGLCRRGANLLSFKLTILRICIGMFLVNGPAHSRGKKQ